MPATRRPGTDLMVAPMYCVTIDDARWLRLGVFTTAQAARAAADAYLAQATRLRPPTTGVERVYVSRRPR